MIIIRRSFDFYIHFNQAIFLGYLYDFRMHSWSSLHCDITVGQVQYREVSKSTSK